MSAFISKSGIGLGAADLGRSPILTELVVVVLIASGILYARSHVHHTLFQAAAAHAIRGYLNATAAVEAAVVAAGIASRGPSAAAAAAAAAADAARQAQASLLAEATAALPGCLTDADVCFT